MSCVKESHAHREIVYVRPLKIGLRLVNELEPLVMDSSCQLDGTIRNVKTV
jgi:hypothetical protein